MDNFNIQKFFKSQYLQEDKMSSDREIEIIKKMNPDADEKSLKKIAKLGKGKVSEGVEKEMFTYLDELRDSGVTNMFGAAPYLQREFDLEKREARDDFFLADGLEFISSNERFEKWLDRNKQFYLG